MKVYVVTRGSYSDYAIVAVFADKEMAEAHRHQVDEANALEEYDVVEAPPEQFVVYSVSNDTYHGRGKRHEWQYLAWDYDRHIYKRAERTVWNDGRSVRVAGWDRKAVEKSFEDWVGRHEAAAAGLA